MGSPPRTSSSPPPPPPSATASLASQKMNYTATASSFPTTTDAWMSRPSVSPLKTADEGHFRSSSSSFYAATNGPPSPPPSLAASTPRGQWLADSGRRASYSAPYPSSASYGAPSNGHGGPLGSPHDEQWSPAGYSPTTYLPPPGHGHHHYAQGQPSQAPPSAQPPYPQPVPLPQPTAISSIPMPIPLGQQQPRRRGKLPKATTEYLKDWLHKHAEHPYPTEDEKKRLCAVTGLSMSQVSNWMINARRRILAPARANAAPAAAATPYGAPPQPAPYAHGPVIPRPPSGDSATSRSDGGLMYTPGTQPQSYPPLQPMPVHPASAGNSPPHRSSWPAPSSAPLSAAPSSSTSYFPPPPDGTASRGSPHSTHSEHLLPTPGADTNSQ